MRQVEKNLMNFYYQFDFAERCVASTWTKLVIDYRAGLPFYCGIQDAPELHSGGRTFKLFFISSWTALNWDNALVIQKKKEEIIPDSMSMFYFEFAMSHAVTRRERAVPSHKSYSLVTYLWIAHVILELQLLALGLSTFIVIELLIKLRVSNHPVKNIIFTKLFPLL